MTSFKSPCFLSWPTLVTYDSPTFVWRWGEGGTFLSWFGIYSPSSASTRWGIVDICMCAIIVQKLSLNCICCRVRMRDVGRRILSYVAGTKVLGTESRRLPEKYWSICLKFDLISCRIHPTRSAVVSRCCSRELSASTLMNDLVSYKMEQYILSFSIWKHYALLTVCVVKSLKFWSFI